MTGKEPRFDGEEAWAWLFLGLVLSAVLAAGFALTH